MGLLKSSVFLRYLRKIGQGYSSTEENISLVYLNSLTHQLIGKTAVLIKTGFRFSIFGRLTELNDGVSRDFFQTSKSTKILLNWLNYFKNWTIRLSVTSNCVTSTKTLRQAFLLSPLKVGSIIVITTIITNLVLLVILQRQITLWGWLMRALLLSIGISGLFCNADWPTLKTSSIFFKKGDVS